MGTGPFRLQNWVIGSHLVFAANDQYALGRPKIDEIEVRFSPDPNTLLVNVLGGAVELTLGKTISLEQAQEAQNLWPKGQVDVAPGNAVRIKPQFLYADPPVVLQLSFRRALYHAIDRQQIVDTLLGGLAPPAEDFLLSPNDPPVYSSIKGKIVRYPYDPRRAAQLIEELGCTRGPGGLLRNAAGQSIEVELRTNVVDLNQKTTLTVVDQWRRVVKAVPEIMPQARASDQQYRATFPGFELLRGADLDEVDDYHSSKQKTAENNWKGSNSGYANPGYDALLERYLVTIPIQERVGLIGDLLHHLSDQAVLMMLFWDVEAILIGDRLENVTARHRGSSHAWNAHEWSVTR